VQTSNPQTKSHNVMNGPNAADPMNVVKLITEAIGSTDCSGSTHRGLPSCSGCGGAASGAAACADVFSAAAAADVTCECVGERVFKTGASAALPPAGRLYARMAMTTRNTSPAPAVKSANGSRQVLQLLFVMANSLAISRRMYETLTATLCPIPGAVGQGEGGTAPISTARAGPERGGLNAAVASAPTPRSELAAADASWRPPTLVELRMAVADDPALRSVVFAAAALVGLGPSLDAFAGPRPGACRARGAVSCHASTWPRLGLAILCLHPSLARLFFAGRTRRSSGEAGRGPAALGST